MLILPIRINRQYFSMLVFLADQKNDLENLYFFSQKPRTIVRQSGKKRQLLAFLKDFTALF